MNECNMESDWRIFVLLALMHLLYDYFKIHEEQIVRGCISVVSWMSSICQTEQVDGDESLVCPITKMRLEDPVVLPSGHTVERLAVEEWISKTGTNPFTRKPLRKGDIYPNLLVKEILGRF